MSQFTYEIDSTHSSVHFSVRHMMLSNVRGEFTKVAGTIRYDPENPASSSVEAKIDVSSINTRDAQRDTHLKSPDFLEAEKYPEITFKSRRVEVQNGGGKVIGDLTIHGVTREVTLDVEGPTEELKDPWGFQRVGGSATTKISRKDFGMTWGPALETGGLVVGDEVKITIDIEAVRK